MIFGVTDSFMEIQKKMDELAKKTGGKKMKVAKLFSGFYFKLEDKSTSDEFKRMMCLSKLQEVLSRVGIISYQVEAIEIRNDEDESFVTAYVYMEAASSSEKRSSLELTADNLLDAIYETSVKGFVDVNIYDGEFLDFAVEKYA